jgi:hypothetical protein
MTITISGSGTIGGPTTFTDNVTLGTSLLATPSGATPSYLCRAWVNFNGTGTVAIRASGNVTSITDNGTGDYTVNFTAAMPDANYATIGTCELGSGGGAQDVYVSPISAPTTAAVRINVGAGTAGAATYYDSIRVNIAIFR